MVRKFLAGAVCALAFTTTAAMAGEAPAAPAEPQANQQAQPDPNEVVCKEETVIGTRFTKRVCMTRAQREARAKAGREATEGMQKDTGGAPENMGGG